MKPRFSVWSCCVAMALMAMVVSCGGGGSSSGTSTPPPAAPTITSFAASPTSIIAGSPTYLTGVFANGTGSMTDSVDSTTWTMGSGEATVVMPAVTTSYTLTVKNSVGVSATKTTTVTVTPVIPPTITSFTANPTSITAGGTAILTGVFANGAGVITPGDLTVTSGTGMIVTPSATTTYTLTVTDAYGTAVTQTATVTIVPVVALPTIASFTANPATIVAGASTALTGVFANGTGVISPGNLPATSGTAANVTPATTTTYTLTVTPAIGQAITQTVTVTVNPWLPTASAGPAQMVEVGSLVTLNGSGSTGRNGDALTYAWTLSTKPSGSGANLSSTTAVGPTFVPDLAGTYMATLIVSDGGFTSNPATVNIVCVSNLSQLFTGAEVSASKTIINGVFHAVYGLNLVNNSSNRTFNLNQLTVTQGPSTIYSTTDQAILNGGQIAPGQSPAFFAATGISLSGTLTATFSLKDPVTNTNFVVTYTFPA